MLLMYHLIIWVESDLFLIIVYFGKKDMCNQFIFRHFNYVLTMATLLDFNLHLYDDYIMINIYSHSFLYRLK